MAMDGLPEGVPPPGRVLGQLLQAAPILKRQRRRYREDIGKKDFDIRAFLREGNI